MSTNTDDQIANAQLQASANPAATKFNTNTTAIRRSSSKRVTDLLFEHNLISPAVELPRTTLRYININMNFLFTQLTSLYATWFQSNWPHFEACASLNEIPIQGASLALARIYISAWLLDLYSTIRESLQKVDPESFNTHFSHERPRSALQYDHYLSRLNASIRPTQLRLIMRTCICVPLITFNERNRHSNPLNIRSFNYRPTIVKGINEIMSSKSLCTLTPLSTDPMGNPAWLFDFHKNVYGCSTGYAWFPKDANFSDEDLTVAFILGDSCTPHLGPVQYDEWQWYPNYKKGTTVIDPRVYPRVSPRTMHGNAEVYVLEEQLGIVFPDFYSRDQRAIHANNSGPLSYPYNPQDFPIPSEEIEVDEPISAPSPTQASGSTSSSRELVIRGSTPEEDPDATNKRARLGTRKTKVNRPIPANIPNQLKVDRFRILIYVYHSKVIVKTFQTTRLACLNQYLSV